MTRAGGKGLGTKIAVTVTATVLLGMLAQPASQAQNAPAAATPAPAQSQAAAPRSPFTTGVPQSMIPTTEIPYFADWASSPHAKASAMAFNHWNSEKAIPTTCARCHSTPGYRDYLGADGTQAGVVDHPAPVGTLITCRACHNAKTRELTSVTFPSGLTVKNLGPSVRCMVCHQGRESTKSVNAALKGMGDDTVNPRLAFIDVHYRAAAATMMGNLAQVAYQYPGRTYAGRFMHQDAAHPFAQPYDTCIACHHLHTVAVKVRACSACHKQVTDLASLKAISVSKLSYDGTGNTSEGIGHQVDNLKTQLMAAIQLYAKTVSKRDIAYDGNTYPYFFVDENGNGVVDKSEAKFPNRYNAWTPRLIKATYNYLFVDKDPGAFAHNPTYTIEILYDSISDLGKKVKVDISKLKRP